MSASEKVRLPVWAKKAMYFGDKKPMEVACDMGFDAMRICLGGKPQNYSVEEVLRWIELMTKAGQAERGQ